MSTALVGPLPTITFLGGPGAAHGNTTRVAYAVPRNTLDPRFAACTDHHRACDCREALLAEDINEWRGEYREVQRAAHAVLAGHQLRVPGAMTHEEYERGGCQCTGCQITRRSHLLTFQHYDMTTGVIR